MAEESRGWFRRGSTSLKVAAISACGLMIGLGLCGLDSHLYPGEEFGGTLALVGAAFFVLSAVGFGVALLICLVVAVSRPFPK